MILHSLRIFLFLLFCAFPIALFAQISHGGSPLPINIGKQARSASTTAKDFFEEMPAFDVSKAMLRSEQDGAKFKSLEFAHKFHVHFRPDNSGTVFTSGNMRVWRVGIRSKKAYSLNILFSKFRLPDGAKVFVYNYDQTEILGSYTHENNTDLNLLPVQPIAGEELIVEYQEPTNASFRGEIEIGEVNHDFRGLFRATEPRDPRQKNCHPNIVCYPEDLQSGRAVVTLIINGTVFCTGSLVNNTSEDGTPYLLTATHCLNYDFAPAFMQNRRYDLVAGSIVAFFNYQSPVCEDVMRGPTQMSLASADSVLINEKYDISLLKFKQMPPKEYQPYYLGWNVSSSPQPPFHGVHHPNGGTKKVAVDNDKVTLGNMGKVNGHQFEQSSFWIIGNWDVASTEGGSSGSPLLDRDKRVLGTLTGGKSECSLPKGPDQYAGLHKAWSVAASPDNPNSLKSYLDPKDLQISRIDGFNPYEKEPYTKSSNYLFTDSVAQYDKGAASVFTTNNTFGYTEFAEEFNATIPAKLEGVFIASSSTSDIQNINVKIKIFADNNGVPGAVLHEEAFRYSYRYYQSGNFYETNRDMNRTVENYVKFSSPVAVSGRFFVSYSETKGVANGFAVLNIKPRKVGTKIASTAWMKNSTGWVKSSENAENPLNTSLLIAPYVIGTGLSAPVPPQEEDAQIKVYFDKEVNRLFIESNKDLVSWEIFYASGLKVFEAKAEGSINKASIHAGMWTRGVYVVRVEALGKKEILKVLVR